MPWRHKFSLPSELPGFHRSGKGDVSPFLPSRRVRYTRQYSSFPLDYCCWGRSGHSPSSRHRLSSSSCCSGPPLESAFWQFCHRLSYKMGDDVAPFAVAGIGTIHSLQITDVRVSSAAHRGYNFARILVRASSRAAVAPPHAMDLHFDGQCRHPISQSPCVSIAYKHSIY